MSTALIITGPTASGKTRLAVALARHFQGEIISADSRQVYRGMNLGTGKDLEEYGVGPEAVPVHLIDVAEPTEDYNLKRFLASAQEVIQDIESRGKLPIIAGGTPLYVHGLLQGYTLPGGEPPAALRNELAAMSHEDLLERLKRVATPELLARADLSQDKRIRRAIEIAESPVGETLLAAPLERSLVLAPLYTRETIRRRIEIRLDQRLKDGMIDEVKRLHDQGVSWDKMEWFGLEYRYVSRFLRNLCTYDEMRTELLAKIRHFCKSQDIWFRKMEREGQAIYWLPEGNGQDAIHIVERWRQGQPLPPPSFRLSEHLNGPQTGRQSSAKN